MNILYNTSKDWLPDRAPPVRSYLQPVSLSIVDTGCSIRRKYMRGHVCELDYDKLARMVAESYATMYSATQPSRSGEDYELSEPIAIGGPAGTYSARSPFMGPSQFKVDIASCGASAAIALVSTQRRTMAPLFVAADQGTGDSIALTGLLLFLPANNTIPVASNWYDIVDSEGLYLYL